MKLLLRAKRRKHLGELALFRWSYDWGRTAPASSLDSDRILILLFNGMWGKPPNLPASDLPADCEVTMERQRMREADAAVFHIPSLGALTRVRKFPGQLWVAQSMECEAHYPRLRDSEFMSRFDLTMTYRRDADVVISYLDRPGLERLLRTPPRPKEDEQRIAAYFASGRHDLSGRFAYVAELMRFLDVHSYGRQLRNRRLRPDHGWTSKIEVIATYKFTLAIENAIAPDYVTEKFFDPLIAGSVPVYLGAPNVADFAPGDHCYIDVADFSGPAALADHLLTLSRDEAAYREYLTWKQRPLRHGFLEFLSEQQVHPLIRLCELIRDSRARGLPWPS